MAWSTDGIWSGGSTDTCAGPAGAMFKDSFEANNFTLWTATVGAPTIQSLITYSGIYAMDVTGAASCYAQLDFAAQLTCHVRAYVYLDALVASGGNNNWILALIVKGAGLVQGWAGVWYDGAKWVWKLLWNNGAGSSVAAAPLPALHQWYCMELKTFCNAGAGEARLYIDGVDILNATALNMPDAVDRVNVGLSGDAGSDIKIDCVVFDDSYIGV